MTYQFEKHFTLAEANALIPAIRQAFADIHLLVRTKGPGPGEEDTAKHKPGTNGNGNGAIKTNGIAARETAGPSAIAELSFKERATSVKEMLTALQRFGIVVQDVMRGLIDFPCIHDGREVFLCYELSDGDQIRFYHEVEAGYAGRHPITDDFN